MIVLNLKTYSLSLEKALDFVEIAEEISEEARIRIPIAVPYIHLKDAAKIYKDVFAQHVDDIKPGAFTGSIPVEAIKIAKAAGSLLNHSEKKVSFERIKTTLNRMNDFELETIICAESQEEVLKIGRLNTKFIAIEPPELIGTGISVSKAKPEIIKNTVETIATINKEIQIFCGAGITNKEDIQKSIELGANGVLVASAFVNSKNPKEFLRLLVSAF
ncbi:MAG: triose-phosphate isomerase [Candidatus Micrarchaeota archaeon]